MNCIKCRIGAGKCGILHITNSSIETLVVLVWPVKLLRSPEYVGLHPNLISEDPYAGGESLPRN